MAVIRDFIPIDGFGFNPYVLFCLRVFYKSLERAFLHINTS